MDSFTLNCQIILAGQQLSVKYIMHFNSDREYVLSFLVLLPLKSVIFSIEFYVSI